MVLIGIDPYPFCDMAMNVFTCQHRAHQTEHTVATKATEIGAAPRVADGLGLRNLKLLMM